MRIVGRRGGRGDVLGNDRGVDEGGRDERSALLADAVRLRGKPPSLRMCDCLICHAVPIAISFGSQSL